MVDSTIADARYTYIHDDQKGLFRAIDTHHIVVRRNASMGFFVKLSAFLLLLLLVANPLFLFLVKDKSVTTFLWSLLLGAVVVKLFFRRRVEKESVIIMPSFGVQLETHYKSGRTIHQFIPISKILKAVLNECVTPVTCYWSLSLLVRGEEQLLLVFRELRPPAKMLIPIWKALCSAADGKESANMLK